MGIGLTKCVWILYLVNTNRILYCWGKHCSSYPFLGHGENKEIYD